MPTACDPVFRTSVPMMVMRVRMLTINPRNSIAAALLSRHLYPGVGVYQRKPFTRCRLVRSFPTPIDSGLMAAHHLRIGLCLLGLTLPGTAFGQAVPGDSTVQSSRDSAPAQTDSAADSAPTRDSASSADTTRSPSDSSPPATRENPSGAPGEQSATDTARSGGAGDSIKPAAAVTPLPTDSILSTACSGSAGSTTTAPDLLVVTFTPESGRAERAAAAKSVRGKLLGQVPSEPGAYYLSVPSGGQEYRLRAAADQLVLQPQVRQVGTRACPPAPPPDTTRPGPTTQPPPER